MSAGNSRRQSSSGIFGHISQLLWGSKEEPVHSKDPEEASHQKQVDPPIPNMSSDPDTGISGTTLTRLPNKNDAPYSNSLQQSNRSAFSYATVPQSYGSRTATSGHSSHQRAQRSVHQPVDAFQACIDNCDPNDTLAEFFRSKNSDNLTGVEAATVLKLICKAVDNGESLVDFDNVLDMSYSKRNDSFRDRRRRRSRKRLVPTTSELSLGYSDSEYPSHSLVSDSFWNTSKRKWAPIEDDLSYAELSQRGGAMLPRDSSESRPIKRSATRSSMISHITQTASLSGMGAKGMNQDTSTTYGPERDVARKNPAVESTATATTTVRSVSSQQVGTMEVNTPTVPQSSMDSRISPSAPLFTAPLTEMRPLARSSIAAKDFLGSTQKSSSKPILAKEEAVENSATTPNSNSNSNFTSDSNSNSNSNSNPIGEKNRVLPAKELATDKQDSRPPVSKIITYEVHDLSEDERLEEEEERLQDKEKDKDEEEIFSGNESSTDSNKRASSEEICLSRSTSNGSVEATDRAESIPANSKAVLAQVEPAGETAGPIVNGEGLVTSREAKQTIEKTSFAPEVEVSTMLSKPQPRAKTPPPEETTLECSHDLMEFDVAIASFEPTPKRSTFNLSPQVEGEVSIIEIEYDFS